MNSRCDSSKDEKDEWFDAEPPVGEGTVTTSGLIFQFPANLKAQGKAKSSDQNRQWQDARKAIAISARLAATPA
jgi:hypothetical protein